MCLFGADRSESPPTQEYQARMESYEQQETMSGVDMMIRHFRSQSYREYQLRNPESRSPSPRTSPNTRLRVSPPSILRAATLQSIPEIVTSPCMSISSVSTSVHLPYQSKQQKIFTDLISDT